MATNESLTLELRAPSGWCQGLRLWPVWATWLRLAQAKGAPHPHRRPSASPHSHWAWRAEAVWVRRAQMSYRRGHAFSQERLQTFAHILLSFWNAVPSSKLNLLVLPAWPTSLPCSSGPTWALTPLNTFSLGYVCLPWLGHQGFISSAKPLLGWGLCTFSGPQQLARGRAQTREPASDGLSL